MHLFFLFDCSTFVRSIEKIKNQLDANVLGFFLLNIPSIAKCNIKQQKYIVQAVQGKSKSLFFPSALERLLQSQRCRAPFTQ